VRVALLTIGALLGFAANSLLTRSALTTGVIDPSSFMIVRLLTGALTLALIVRARGPVPRPWAGTWRGAVALSGYAIAFTIAYTRIGAAVGALLLFGAVQTTMIAAGLLRGERPRRSDWLGVAIAVAGLLVLTLPGAAAPDALGAALMIAAGMCWGVYSMLGRGARAPLLETAGNFVRACVVILLPVAVWLRPEHITTRGAMLATASGALASGVGYSLWYAALPSLTAVRAAVVQLTVPIVTALAATWLLGESVTSRLAIAALLVASGVGLTIRRPT